MKPEQQRIAIAEACGWRAELWERGGWMLYSPKGDRVSDCGSGSREAAFEWSAPDYLNDLNAMHAAEKALTENQWFKYFGQLPGDMQTYGGRKAMIHATAAQRSEAFLRTLNLWKD